MTTVGYGDVTPTTSGGKVFTIVYTLVGCSLAAKGFRDVVTYPLIVKAKENELFITRQFGDELSESTLSNLLQNDFFNRIPNLRRDNKQIQKSEFVLLLLRMMGKVCMNCWPFVSVSSLRCIYVTSVMCTVSAAGGGQGHSAGQQDLRQARLGVRR